MILQVNGIFESFIKSICHAVLEKKSKDVLTFTDLEEKIRIEYIYHSAVILAYSKEGSVRGRGYDFVRLQNSLAGCILGKENFEIRPVVFTLLMGNCTPSRICQLFEVLCLSNPFGDRIGNHPGLKKCANATSKRKVSKYAKETLNEQIILRNEIAHGNLTKAITSTEFQVCVQFFKEYMRAITESTIKDLKDSL